MKIVHSKLFGSEVAILKQYERKPDDKVWFTEVETEQMKTWTDWQKVKFFELKQVFGSETTISTSESR